MATLSLPRLLLRPVLLLLLLLCSAVVCNAQSLYSFCYTLSSALSTSPLFPFSIAVSGTINVSLSSSVALSAVGQRVVIYRGRQYSTAIASLAPPSSSTSSYPSNDNVLSVQAPYLSAPHALAFTYVSAPYTAYGPSSSSTSFLYNDSVYGLAEDSTPPSDGVVATVISTFSLTPSSTYSASVACALPAVPGPTAAQSAALSSTVSWSWCYAFTGGPGDVSYGAGVWSITASGTFTTSAYSGQANGVDASIIVNVTGVRTYTDVDGSAHTATLTGLAPSNGLLGSYASNVLYAAYPYLDSFGVYFSSSSPLSSAMVDPAPAATVGQLFIDSYSMFDETIVDLTTGLSYETPVGTFDLALTSAGASSLQCAFTAGATLTYAFCYSLQSPPSASPSFVVQAYGVLTATGPVVRQGRSALTIQSMTGIRAVTIGTAPTTVQNIVRLVYVNGDAEVSDSYILNDNTLYSSTPYIDYFGLDFALSSNVIYPDHVAATTDVNLSEGSDGTWYDWPAVGTGVESTAAQLNYTQAPTSTATFPCSAAAVPASYSLSFCYTSHTSAEQLMASGTLWLYGAALSVGGRSANALQSASGVRLYQNSAGVVNRVAITGVSADSFGAVEFAYNQLLYASAPLLDASGLLFTLAPGAVTSAAAALTGDAVVSLAWLNGTVVESAQTAAGVQLVAVAFSVSAQPLSCSLLGFGGGGSSLSGGAIAGVVIGSVVGAALLLVAVLLLLRCAAGADGSAKREQPTSPAIGRPSYEAQRDASSKQQQPPHADAAVQLA